MLDRLRRADLLPVALLLALALLAWPLVGTTTWVTLTVAGIAMGLMIFVMASGLTLVFGLMDVLNFGHGAFISVGAFVAVALLAPFGGWLAGGPGASLAAMLAAALAAMVVAGLLGWAFERLVVRPVYGQHLKQILVTMGGFIVVEQLLIAIWGASPIPLPRPEAWRGAVMLGEAAIERYRLLAVVLGVIVLVGLQLVLRGTRLGLLIRAGVENREMVEALGYRIRRLFVLVFVAGSGLAGLGGVLWAYYQEVVSPAIGMQLMVLIFIVIIIGGLGSVLGCLLGAVLVGLVANYTGFLAPKLALASNVLLMALILAWRPEGLYPAVKR